MDNNQHILLPDYDRSVKILPSPSDKIWRKFKQLVKMAREAYDEAEFEAQEKYTKAAWEMLGLWFDQYVEEMGHKQKIFKKGGKK